MLRSTEAMHNLLSHPVRFDCIVCKERFAGFHSGSGLSWFDSRSVRVGEWCLIPDFGISGDPPSQYTGVCTFCRDDIDSEPVEQEGVEGDACIIAKRSHLNHMDPCFRFAYDDLQALFDGATVIEGMLVALEHMQINVFSCSSTLSLSLIHI